jgi:dihydroorotate dehydrogenase electron transfer subunit
VETMTRCATDVIYACGPHPMLAAVSRIGVQHELPVQVAVEELMACGYGVCMTCVMPVTHRSARRGQDQVSYVRSCTEGPVLDGATVVWNGAPAGDVEEESELAPAGSVARGLHFDDAPDEHPPPGN